MSNVFTEISAALAQWITRQHLFFVATAPLAAAGHVNCSPKGMDTLRILGPREVAYLDLTGSGSETIAHVRENSRIVLMLCAFTGPPNIVRLHGRATVVTPGSSDWTALSAAFPAQAGARSIIHVQITRVSDSCGYAVPTFEYVADRDALIRWADHKGDEGLRDYRAQNNTHSIDDLPSLM